MFVLKKLILSIIGLGFAFGISSSHETKKKIVSHSEKVKEKIVERHHRRW